MAKPVKKQPLKPAQETNLLLKYANMWLVLAVLVVYVRVFMLSDLTHLDDTIFIRDKGAFNKDFSNIFRSFIIGCFNEKDIYYRPLFLVSFIIESPFAGGSYFAYHLFDLMLHAANVLLLFHFLKRINIVRHVSFVFALLFAVHPVLTMAVAWIPGRNDLLLTTFALSFFISLIRFSEKPTTPNYLLQLLFLFLCLFTKETAVFIPFVAVLLLLLWKRDNLLQGKYIGMAAGWAIALGIWYLLRLSVLPEDSTDSINLKMVLGNFIHRTPGLLQYIGKIILPVNLSVFPTIQDTTFIFGAAAMVILISLIVANRQANYRMVALGTGWFLFFILPFFFVPRDINDQLFEHRLYLPIVGIFIMLSQSVLFLKRFPAKRVMLAGCLLAIGLSVITIMYIGQFDNKLTFWKNAVTHSPNSSYANKLYGIKLAESDKKEEAIPYFKKAYAIDSTERYTNLFLARLIDVPANDIVSAEKHLKNEIRLNPTFLDTYFEIAHVYFMKNDFENAKQSLIQYLHYKPNDDMGNNNLLKLYYDLKQYPEAKRQIENMEMMGMQVDATIKNVVTANLQYQQPVMDK